MNKLSALIKEKSLPYHISRPTTEFFKQIHIGKKRWGQLVREEKSPTLDELQSIAALFKVDIQELI